MKRIISSMLIMLFLPMYVFAAPQTIYRGVEQRGYQPPVNHHPNPVFNHQAPQQPSYNRYPQSNYPTSYRYPVQRPKIAVVTPHVGIYVNPEPSYHYQKTEEVYLPQGGTYRSVTEYIPQSIDPPYSQKRRVIGSGQFKLND